MVKPRSLTMLRAKPIKVGAKVVTHFRHVIFEMAEAAVPRALFTTAGRFRLKRAVRLGTITVGDQSRGELLGRVEVNHESI